MNVKRYDGKVGHCDNGAYVSYEDYAALLKQRDALAAENTQLKEYRPQPGGPAMMEALDAFFEKEEYPEGAMMDAFEILCCKRALPATDAAIANIQAQGVDKYAEMFKLMADMNIKHNQEFITLTEWYAKQLRKEPTHD